MCWYLGILFGSTTSLSSIVRCGGNASSAQRPSCIRSRLQSCGAAELIAGWKVGLDLCVDGHSTMWGPQDS